MRILLAITGASGMAYARTLAEALRKSGHRLSVVASKGAQEVARAEGEKLPRADFGEDGFFCPYASGSNAADAMVVCPCSLKTLGEIANGAGSTLITRAAEVCLKERRRLVLVVRETPLSYIAIKNMETVTLAGAVVLPACPGFYHKPKKVQDLVDFVAGKTLDCLGVKNNLFRRWKE